MRREAGSGLCILNRVKVRVKPWVREVSVLVREREGVCVRV